MTFNVRDLIEDLDIYGEPEDWAEYETIEARDRDFESDPDA